MTLSRRQGESLTARLGYCERYSPKLTASKTLGHGAHGDAGAESAARKVASRA